MSRNSDGTLTRKVLEFIYQNPGSKPSDVANCLGISRALAYRVIASLKSRGLVKKVGQGYVVTDRARAIVESGTAQSKHSSMGTEMRGEASKRMVEAKRFDSLSGAEMIGIRREIEVVKRELESLENRIRLVDNVVEKLLELLNVLSTGSLRQGPENPGDIGDLVMNVRIADLSLVSQLLSMTDNASEICGNFVVIEDLVVSKRYLEELAEVGPEALTSIEKAILDTFKEFGGRDLCAVLFRDDSR